MSGESQPTAVELPVRREEVEQVRFREVGEYAIQNMVHVC
jgi:hypothetical protein